VWKSLENELPGLAAMARDLLCIPLAGVGVERTFNFARDICHYRRGQLLPNTIRSLLLTYHSQVTETRIDTCYQELHASIDVNDMTSEEINLEISSREQEMDLRKSQNDDWDQDHYISDVEADNNIPSRTTRMQLRTDYIARKQRRQNIVVQQSLSNIIRHRREELVQQLRTVERQNRDNPQIWEPISSDSENEVPVEEVNENQDGEQLELPPPRRSIESQGPVGIHSAKRRRGEEIIERYVRRRTSHVE
jgi:hAT family C-terminal dimerisation region